MKYILALSILLIFLIGCSSAPTSVENIAPNKYNDRLAGAPFWVNNPLSSKDSDLARKSKVKVALAVKGLATVHSGNIPVAYEEAVQDGRARLAELIRSEMKKEITKNFRRYKRDGDQILDDDLRIISRSVTEMDIHGALPLHDWTSNDNTMYVLVILEPENFERIKKTALRKLIDREDLKIEKNIIREYHESLNDS